VVGPARATAPLSEALSEGRRKSAPTSPLGNAARVLALQRAGGNAAVTALLEGKAKAPGDEAVGHIDAALQELRGDDPVIETVEKGLKAAEAAGVPVQLEGPKPPPSALAVTMTGFGPDAVAPPGPTPSPKPVPAANRMGAAAAKAGENGAGAGANGAAPPSAAAVEADSAVGVGPAAALSPDQLAEPPVPPTGVAPTEDPAFNRVSANIKAVASDKRAHPAASSKAQEAQNAAEPPTGDVAGQAKAAKVDTMDAQQPGTFDKKAFIAAVKAAIEAKSPKTLEQADQYAQSGKAGEVKGEVKGLVTQGKQGEAKDIDTATAAEPDTSKAVPKPVTPMGGEEQSAAPSIPGEGAAPKPAPPEQLNLEAGKQQVNQDMADAQVTDEQLAQSNEPTFQKALADKQTAAAHADTAPGEYRQQEQGVIAQHQAQATTETQTGVAGMHDAKAAALAKLVADKGQAKSKDEGKRAEVTARVQEIYAATETDVKKILDGIDAKVDKAFEEGEASARQAFESFVTAKMDAYKEDRYSGWLGGLRWAKDKLVGMPDDVNRFYEAGRELYLKRMDGVISRVADIVGDDLGAAKRRIAAGKNEIASYVKTLPANLQSIGADATKEIGAKFEQLESDVDAKQQSVVDTMADKYVEARKGLDDRIGELQAENKGLVDQAIGAITGVISTIRDLANMLMNTLARVADTVGDIIKHPVQFLGNLVEGVKGGILKFKDNILDHLRKGLMTWLFGALADAGIELPETFDVKGIIHLLLSLFGLTWTNIRSRIVAQIGEKAMGAIEKGVEIFQTIATQGVAGLWNMLLEKLGDIKEMILAQVKDFVVTKIITAGITWLIGLLNPAAAFIKACKLIYDIIMFFVDNGERIMKFVNTVIDSVRDILAGNIGTVVNKIDDVLGQMVPILIGFLASAIGIGGIGEKIKEILQKLQKPVNMAIDFLIKKGLQLAAPIIAKIKGIAGKVKGKIEAGKAWVKGKVAAGKEWLKSKLPGAKQDEPETRTQEQMELDLKQAVNEGTAVANKAGQTKQAIIQELAGLEKKHALKSLKVVTDSKDKDKERVHIRGEVNPTYDGDGFITSTFPPGKVVINAAIGPSRPRAHYERKVLESPTAAGLPGYQRAHLLGAGFGVESPLGLYYAPRFVNLVLQNNGIEQAIREAYRTRYPGAELFIKAEATPHPGTDLLARVVYTLSGRMPGISLTDICQFRIIISANTAAPTWKVQAGEVDPEAIGMFTPELERLMSLLGPDV
jgi:Bacterial toxin 4